MHNYKRALAITAVIAQLFFISVLTVRTSYADDVVAPEPTAPVVVEETAPLPLEATSTNEAPPAPPQEEVTPPVSPATTPEDVVPPAAPSTDDTVVPLTEGNQEVAPAPTEEVAPVAEETVPAPTPAPEELVAAPVLSTDKEDYHPGETATIFGRFFGKLQTYVLKVFGYGPNGDEYTEGSQSVTTDNEGSFTTTYTLENIYRPLYTAVVNALTGEKIAETSFTDSKLGSVDLGAQSASLTYGAPATTTFSFTLTRGSNSGAQNNIALSITSALPAGVSYSFSPNPVNLPNANSSVSGTLSIGTNSATQAGSYSFTVQAVGDATVSTTSTLVINKRSTSPNLSATSTKVYDGTTAVNTVCAVSTIGTDKVACTQSSVSYANKNVGNNKTVTATGITLTGPQAGNYQLTTTTAAAVANITQLPITVTAASSTKVYDGLTTSSALPTITVGALASGDTAAFTETYDIKNVGSGKTMTATGTVTDTNGGNNYAVTFATNGNGTITPKPINVVVGTGQGKVFGASEPTLTSTNDALIAPDTYSGAITRTAGENAGSYPITKGTLSAGTNYTINFTGANFVISQAPSVTTVTCPASATYTGSALTPCSATVTGAGGLSLTPTPAYTNNTTVGTAGASYSFAGDTNHSASSDSKNFAITQAGSVTAITCPSSVAYSGAAQTPCTATVTGVGGLSQAVTVNHTNNTNAGTAHATANFAGDTNHTASGDAKDFTITQAASVTTITCPVSQTYTGSALTPCSATVEGVGGLSLTPTPDHSSNTNAGTAHADYTYAGDTNHTESSDAKTFTITQADSVTTVTCPASVVFDGTAQTPCTASVTGVGGLSLTPTPSHSDNTHVGTASASYTFAGDSNHSTSTDTKHFAITQAASLTTLTCSDVTYSGLAQTPCTAIVTGVGGLSQAVTVNHTNNTNAGTAHATANFAGDTDHTASSDAKDFTIAKADADITVTPYAVTFDATQHTATAVATGVLSEDLASLLDLSGTTHTNAGTYASDAWTFAGDANYNSANGTVSDSIAKAGSITTLTCTDVTYTGDPQEPCSASVSGVGGLNTPVSVLYTNNTSAGTAHATADFAGDADHEASGDAKDFTIAQAASVTTLTCSDVTYTGTAQEPCTASVTGVGGLNASVTVFYTNNTNAGTAHATADFAGDANHEASGDAKDFTIGKADATIVVTPYTVAFDAATHTAVGTAKGVADESLLGLDLSATTHTNAGAYNGDAWTFTDVTGNYNNANGTVDDAVTKIDATILVSGYTGTYDGAAHGATGSATGVGATPLSGLDLGASFTNVPGGTAHWVFTDVTGNYNDASGDVAITISKADAAITVTPYSVTFDGAAHTATTVATGVLSEDLASLLDLSGTTHTAAGTYGSDAWTFAGDTNYNAANGTVSDTIGKASSVTTLDCSDVTYTGTAQEPCTASVTGVGGLNASVTVFYTNNTNAGTAHATADFAGDANHEASSDAKDFTIAKADADITVTPYAVTFDGVAHTATAVATGVLSEDLSSLLDLTATTHTTAGTYAGDAWTFAGNTNYNTANGTVDDEINKADSVTTLTCTDVMYNGTAQEPCTVSVTGAAGLNTTTTIDYTDNTNAGTAHAHAEFTGDNDHESSDDEKDFTIAKADATIAVTPYAVTFDGSAHTATAVVTGVLVEDLSSLLDLSGTTHTNAGTYSNDPWTFSGNANYNSTSGTASDTIAKASSITELSCGDVTYNGAPQEPCAAAVSGANGLSAPVTVLYTNNTNAGTAHATADFAGDADHEASGDATDFTIAKTDADITVTPYAVTFDGSAHTATAIATGYLSEDLSSLLDLSGTTHTGAGTYGSDAWTFAGDINYNAASGTVSDTIAQADSVTTLTCSDVTYNGGAQTPCTASVTGVAGLNEAVTVNYTANTNAGTAHATANFAGDADHAASSDAKDFTINKADATIAVTPYSVAFDAAAHTATGVATGVLSEDLASLLDLSGTTHTNAGTYGSDAWTFAGDTNYNAANGTVADAIAQAGSVTTLTCSDVTYTGAAQEPCTASVTGIGGLNATVTVLYTSNTDAGTAHATADFVGDADHSASGDAKDFTIGKADTATLITCPVSKVFTGLPITPCTTSVTGIGGLSLTPDPLYTGNTSVGTAHADYTFLGDTNHNGSGDAKTFAITTATSVTTIICPASVTYTGAAQTPCTASVTGIGGLNAPVTVVYTSNTNAGTAHATADFAGDADHAASGDAKDFTVGKAAPIIAVTPYTLPYDGLAHTGAGTAKGVLNESLTGLDLSGTTHTNAGSYAGDAWTFTDITGNYSNASGTVSDMITKINAHILVAGYTGTYDAAAHGASGSATGTTPAVLSGLTLGASFTNVPGGTAHWVFTDVTGNYNNASGDVAIVINKKNATVTPDTGTKVLGAIDPVLTGTLVGFLPANGVTATYTRASGEDVGTYPISATLLPVGVLGNYAIASSTANFTITAGVGNLTVNKVTLGGDGIFTFLGSNSTTPFTIATVSGSGAKLLSSLVAGTYSVAETLLPVGWTQVSTNCDSVDVLAGNTSNCTISNAKQGQIIVKKVTSGGTGTFHFTTDYNPTGFDLAGGAQNTSVLLDPTDNDTETSLPDFYSVQEDAVDGWTQTSATCSNGDDPATIHLAPGATVTCTFTNTKNTPTNQKGEISGIKFEDTNGSGIMESGEKPLPGVVIYIDTNNNGNRDRGERFTITNRDGQYRFRFVSAGTYTIREVVRKNWMQTAPTAGKYSVTLAAGQIVTGKDFGNFKYGVIKGAKFEDKNGNGKRDNGERWLKNWTIKLRLPNGSFVTTTTGEDGKYAFRNLGPGVYEVTEVQQAGWTQKTVNPAPIVISSRTVSTGNNFGNKKN